MKPKAVSCVFLLATVNGMSPGGHDESSSDEDAIPTQHIPLEPYATINPSLCLCTAPPASLTLSVNLPNGGAPLDTNQNFVPQAHVGYYDTGGIQVGWHPVNTTPNAATNGCDFPGVPPPPHNGCIGQDCPGETYNVVIHWGGRCFFPGGFSYRPFLCNTGCPCYDLNPAWEDDEWPELTDEAGEGRDSIRCMTCDDVGSSHVIVTFVNRPIDVRVCRMAVEEGTNIGLARQKLGLALMECIPELLVPSTGAAIPDSTPITRDAVVHFIPQGDRQADVAPRDDSGEPDDYAQLEACRLSRMMYQRQLQNEDTADHTGGAASSTGPAPPASSGDDADQDPTGSEGM